MVGLDLDQRRTGLGVLVVGVNLEGRAGHEDVALGRVNRRNDFTGQHDLLALDVRVRGERRREERIGVQVNRVVEDAFGIAHLLHYTEIHNCHAVTHVAHCREVVRDHDVSQAVLLLKINEQVHYLCANGHVKRGHRLVERDDLRVQ